MRLIRRESKAEIAKIKKADSEVPVDLFVHYLTAAFLSVLTWWLDRRGRLTPSQINQVFRSLVLPSTLFSVKGIPTKPAPEWQALSFERHLRFGDGCLAPTLSGPDRLQKTRQFGRSLVLRNRIQFLKGAGECVRE